MRTTTFAALPLTFTLLTGCSQAPADDVEDPTLVEGKADSSAEATFLTFEFDGELLTTGSLWGGEKAVIQDHLLYTIGHLNGDRSVGRLDRLDLTDIKTAPEGMFTKVRYHARLPVAWGSKTNLPTSYDFSLPRRIDYAGQEAFTAKYKASCVDWGAHDVDVGSIWYYYRPRASACKLDAADIVKTTAKVTVSPTNTTGKYPEYHKVWEDNALRVVAIFGKYEDGATTTSDAGIAAYNNFVAAVKSALGSYSPTTTPAQVSSSPGISTPDIAWTASLPGGKSVVVNALLVDNVRTAGAAFDKRYEELSTRADLIIYNGHAGLGQNVRALARKGRFVAGQYAIIFMNGCDTFAYVDGSLAETRARLNPDDPTGTKYMDILTNGMPAFFSNMPYASMAMVKGLLNHAQPMTYEQIFKGIDRSQVVLVTGEEDNTFAPAQGGFVGQKEMGSASKGEELRFQTAALPAGSYLVRMTHDPQHPGGDADLYVKAGSQPTRRSYACRPYKNGSTEECRVTLAAESKIFVSVFGYSQAESWFLLSIDPTN